MKNVRNFFTLKKLRKEIKVIKNIFRLKKKIKQLKTE